jgi:hypothetical protein
LKFRKKKAPEQNNCAQKKGLFLLFANPRTRKSCVFKVFSGFSGFMHFIRVLKGIHAKPCFSCIFHFFMTFFGFWIQILDLLGLPPTWYLLASISRRKLATHIPWTLSHHGCYVASSNELDDAKTIQIFAS